ncbi:MAG: hypothetical protein WB580_22620 [Candidatus Binataceae bacterium]|jgi:hypothetical protein
MTSQEEISRNQDERDDARQDLRDTLTEVNAKLERAGNEFRPDHLIEGHSVGACLVVGALGFLIGSSINSRVTGPAMIAALLGFALSRRASSESSECDGRATSSDD